MGRDLDRYATSECGDRRLQLVGRVLRRGARGEVERVAEDDLDLAAPAVGAERLPFAVDVVEDRDVADLQLHRYHGRAALDRDEAGAALERLRRSADGQLALGIDEDGELAVETRTEELEAAADRALAREGERVREHRREDAIETVAEHVVRGRGDG